MRRYANTASSGLAIVLAIMLGVWGAANLWGAAAQPKIGEKWMDAYANALVQDGKLDAVALAQSCDRYGLAPLNPDRVPASLAEWLSTDVSGVAIRRYRETAWVCFIWAARCLAIAALTPWAQRPKPT